MPGGDSKPPRGLTWQGWQAYDTHRQPNTDRILRAVKRLVDVPGVKRDLQAMFPNGAEGQHPQALRMITRSVVGQRANRGVLGKPLVAVYRAGWKAGVEAAAHALTVTKDDAPTRNPNAPQPPQFWTSAGSVGGSGGATVTTNVDWSAWQPGSSLQASAARSLEELIQTAVGSDEGWATRAASRGSLLASIEDNRLDKLSNAVAQALADGTSVDSLTGTLEGVLDDPQWAGMVADTELARSMTAASMATYRQANVATIAVVGADDERECQLCVENEAAGEIPIGTDFPNGPPPTHPLCRCAIVPGFTTNADLLTVETQAAFEEG